jgi:hypothetical protein
VAQAEAAQEALLTSPSSPLAPYLEQRPLLVDMCKVYAATQQLYHQQLVQELRAHGIDPGAAPEQPINLRTAAPELWQELQPPAPEPSEDQGGEKDKSAAAATPASAAEASAIDQGQTLDLLRQYVLPDLVTLVTQGGLVPSEPPAVVVEDQHEQQQQNPQQVQQGTVTQLLQALVSQGLPPGHVPDFLGDPGSVPALMASKPQAEHTGYV